MGRSEKLGAGYEFPGPGGLRESVVARTRTEARKGFRAGVAAGWVHRGTAGKRGKFVRIGVSCFAC